MLSLIICQYLIQCFSGQMSYPFTITSVVDDIEFNVTNILRGEDHLTNTAAQIKLFKYLGAKTPSFGHFPLMRSKRVLGYQKIQFILLARPKAKKDFSNYYYKLLK